MDRRLLYIILFALLSCGESQSQIGSEHLQEPVDSSRLIVSGTESTYVLMSSNTDCLETEEWKEHENVIMPCPSDPHAPQELPARDGDDRIDWPTAIVTNQSGDGYEGWLGPVRGVADRNGTVRLYYEDRSEQSVPEQIYYIESDDLESWTEPKPINFRGQIHIFYHEGWKGYAEEESSMVLYTSPDGVHFNRVGTAFTWKLDTAFSAFWDGEKYVMYGRVRGDSDRPGNWPREMSPEIDRRGISFHSNPTWKGHWEQPGKIIADPMDYWDYRISVKPDFYTPAILPDGTGFTSVFWRDDRRVPAARPDRITGPLYPIRTRVTNDTEFEIVSEEPVIPLELHERFSTHPQPTSTEKEVGQLHVYPAIIRGHVFYFYRDDTHYENNNGQHLTGIFIYRLPL